MNNGNLKIKVLIVDDSAVVRDFLATILNSDPDIDVISTVSSAEEAILVIKNKKPDVITMDINMPKMNGIEATREIMRTHPKPIIIVSGDLDSAGETAFRAIEAGALAVVQRPAGINHQEHEATVKELIQTVKLMSEVRVVRRWSKPDRKPHSPVSLPVIRSVEMKSSSTELKLVAIGASTGGPVALHTILAGLSKDFPAPILIVQHIAAGFIEGLAKWLSETSGFPVRVAGHGESLLPGHAYLAPDGFQMGVSSSGIIVLNKSETERGLCPSVSHLFRSVAKNYGKSAVGVILTGMGKDGAAELRMMKENGAITIAQDRRSSIVYGMPGEAINLDAVVYVMSLNDIAKALKTWTGQEFDPAENET